MARRNDHSRDEIREMALKAAETIVEREGAAGLSTRKIANEIGYTVGSLYLIFENLDDLIFHVNARTLDQLAFELDQATARKNDPAAVLVELGLTYLRFAASHQGRWNLIFGRGSPTATASPDWYRSHVLVLFDRVEKMLERLAPPRNPNEVALAARALWGGVHGVCTLALTDKLDIAGLSDAEKLTTSLIENYLLGWMQQN
ncbi:TetR/AcrR family transcriptional regulator [Methylocaldum sp.]|uniref:TetR/AcrR family transcriptional regulator n=1 Tax=Methylocaldum sp. TaxID=1969727 RepID=UPI002D4B30D5|nr:WHG domain-containing protein [Methylocaldum sp.]HYE38044.1 WHG domain-containing protein [Methylocaldum sp.]